MRTAFSTLIALLLVGSSAATWLLPATSAGADVDPTTPPSVTLRRQAIAFFERRLVEDPSSALDMAQLAALRQPKVLVSTELLKAIEETLALYGERLECARASMESMLIDRWAL